MNSERLSHAIRLHDEMVLLKDILSAAKNQPTLSFSFLSSGNDRIFTIKSEQLIDDILGVIRATKENLKEVFKEL